MLRPLALRRPEASGLSMRGGVPIPCRACRPVLQASAPGRRRCHRFRPISLPPSLHLPGGPVRSHRGALVWHWGPPGTKYGVSPIEASTSRSPHHLSHLFERTNPRASPRAPDGRGRSHRALPEASNTSTGPRRLRRTRTRRRRLQTLVRPHSFPCEQIRTKNLHYEPRRARRNRATEELMR